MTMQALGEVTLFAVAVLLSGDSVVRLGESRMRLQLAERVFATPTFGLVLATWAGVTLAHAGAFSSGALSLTLLVAAAALFVARRGLSGRSRSREGGTSRGREAGRIHPAVPVAAALLAILAAWLYGPPFDSRLEARDPGVYELAGWSLAETGSWAYEDGLVRGLDPAVREALFPPPRLTSSVYESARFMGFYLHEKESGRVVPQFLALYPVWVATIHELVGEAGTGYAAWVAALWSIVAMVYLGRRWRSTEVGMVAAVWLALNFSQAWFARFSGAELLAQALFMVGGWSYLVFRRSGAAPFGWMAAIAIGLMTFTKAELLVIAVPLAGLLVWERIEGDARGRLHGFWLPLAIVGAHSAYNAGVVSWPYVQNLTLVVEISTQTLLLGVLLGATAVGTFWWATGVSRTVGLRRGCSRFLRARNGAGRMFRYVLVAAWLAGVAYNWWIRPRGGTWQDGVLVDFGTILTPTGLALAVAGGALVLLRRSSPPGAVPWTMAFLVPVLAVVWNRSIFPDFMWVGRRYLPIMLPLGLLLAAFAATRARQSWSLLTRGRSGQVLLQALGWLGWGLVVGGISFQALTTTLRYRDVPELAGSAEVLQQLDQALAPDALVLVEARSRRGPLRFEAPIDFVLGRQVLRLPHVFPHPAWLRDLVWDQTRRGRTVYLLTTGYIGAVAEPGVERAAEIDWSTFKLAETPERLPDEIEKLRFRFRVYRFVPHGRIELPADGIDIGNWDDLYVEGLTFWDSEADPVGRTYRWTNGDGVLLLPGLPAGPGRLVMVLDSGQPIAPPGRRLEVLLDGRLLATVDLRRGWQQHRIDVPADRRRGPDRVSRLALRIPGFRPSELGTAPDDRILGVKVDSVAWHLAAQEEQP